MDVLLKRKAFLAFHIIVIVGITYRLGNILSGMELILRPDVKKYGLIHGTCLSIGVQVFQNASHRDIIDLILPVRFRLAEK